MRLLLTALVAVFLFLAPGHAQETEPTEPTDCPAAQNINAFFAVIDRLEQGLTRTILSPEASDAYIAAYNAIEPVTDYPATTIAFYERDGARHVYLVMIVDDWVCRHGQIPLRVHQTAMAHAGGV